MPQASDSHPPPTSVLYCRIWRPLHRAVADFASEREVPIRDVVTRALELYLADNAGWEPTREVRLP